MKSKVQMFNCEVRHGGDVMHSLAKECVSLREIRLLKSIHGSDAVVNVKDIGEREIDEQEEAYELALRYSKTMNPRHGVALVERVLNVDMSGFDAWMRDREAFAELERKEKRDKAQQESARFSAARAAADARVRAEIAEQQAAA
jgi:hypothetical protein